MHPRLALAIFAAAAVTTQTEASTCTIADFNVLLSDTTCILTNAPLTALGTSVAGFSETAFSVGTTGFGNTTFALATPPTPTGGGANPPFVTLVNNQLAVQFSPTTSLSSYSTLCANTASAQCQNFIAYVNFTILDQACYYIEQASNIITTCFNANCTNVVWSFCNNPAVLPPVLAGTQLGGELQSLGAELIAAVEQICAAAAAYKTAAPTFQSANPSSTNYNATCQVIFPAAQFGKFQYPTPAPTKKSGNARAGAMFASSVLVALVAGVMGVAF